MTRFLFSFFLFLPFFSWSLEASFHRNRLLIQDPPPLGSFASRQEHHSIEATEYMLENGMRVIVKPTSFEKDEVLIHAIARGGYANLNHQDWVSGRISALVAWESGLRDLTSKQLKALLTSESIDLKIKVHPYYRNISATLPESSLKTTFKLLHLFFTQMHPSEEGLKKVLSCSQDIFQLRGQDPHRNFEDTIWNLNTGCARKLQPATPLDLEQSQLSTIQDFFERSFGNPQDFTLIIVGDCDLIRIEELAKRYLANIPAKRTSFSTQEVELPPFPLKAISQKVAAGCDPDELTQITTPLKGTLQSLDLEAIDMMAQTLETRFREVLEKKIGFNFGVDVGYEYPLFPDRRLCWITILFRTPSTLTEKATQLLLEELKTITEVGPLEEEAEKARCVLIQNDAFWKRENIFWLSTLANLIHFQQPPSSITQREQRLSQETKESVHQRLRELIQKERYTVVTRKHQK